MKQILTIAAILFTSITAVADEGMWMMGNLSARTDSVMQSLGLNLTHKQVFNPYAPSLNDAVVSFGGYCSGVVVSPEGLVFTNHHCGFRSIQANSSTKHDYLKYGFCAKTMADELPNEDLYVDFHLNYHLRCGNTAPYLIRVYFLHDDDNKLIVVGSLPNHLPTFSNKT